LLDADSVGETAIVAISTFSRVDSTHCDDSVEDPHVLEYFLGPGLYALAARAVERLACLFDQAKGNSPSRQLDSHRQTGRARAAHHYLDFDYLDGAGTVSIENVQNAHINTQLRELHGALMEIVGVMNRPQRDEAMVQAAGISLDRALFPLLVSVERLGPIGVGELADRVGRDYTTVSRQVTKLESLELIARENTADRRVRKSVITAKGKAMTDRIDEARARIGRAIFATWDEADVENLVRLMCKFANDIKDDTLTGAQEQA
jgi:DNA-binding MarR family transcriptional regulator